MTLVQNRTQNHSLAFCGSSKNTSGEILQTEGWPVSKGTCKIYLSCITLNLGGALVEWLERFGYDAKSTEGSEFAAGFAIRPLENFISQPSSKWAPFCQTHLQLARHSCYNFSLVYVCVRAFVQICSGHNFYIYALISK